MYSTEKNKKDLETQKLELEIRELKRRWFLKPSNLFPFFTFFITVLTITWTLTSGIVDVKYQSLLLEKKTLEFDIKVFAIKKDSVLRSYNAVLDSLNEQKQTVSKKQTLIDSLLISEQNITKFYIKKFDFKKDSVVQSYNKVVDSLNDLKKTVFAKQYQIDSLRGEEENIVRFYKQKVDSLTKTFIVANPNEKKTKSGIDNKLIFPSAFTPNGDGRNDTFKASLSNNQDLVLFRMMIFNRYGFLLFSSTDPNKGWDGKYDNKYVEAGTYVYVCDYQFTNSESFIYRGTVVMIR